MIEVLVVDDDTQVARGQRAAYVEKVPGFHVGRREAHSAGPGALRSVETLPRLDLILAGPLPARPTGPEGRPRRCGGAATRPT